MRQLHVHLAERRRDLLHDRVVAERRIVIVRIDAPEQRVGRLVEEVAEQLVDRAFARVGARAQVPVLAELAVHVEREAGVQRRVVVDTARSRPAAARPGRACAFRTPSRRRCRRRTSRSSRTRGRAGTSRRCLPRRAPRLRRCACRPAGFPRRGSCRADRPAPACPRPRRCDAAGMLPPRTLIVPLPSGML